MNNILTPLFRKTMFSYTDEGKMKARSIFFVLCGICTIVFLFVSFRGFLFFVTRCINVLHLELDAQSLVSKKE